MKYLPFLFATALSVLGQPSSPSLSPSPSPSLVPGSGGSAPASVKKPNQLPDGQCPPGLNGFHEAYCDPSARDSLGPGCPDPLVGCQRTLLKDFGRYEGIRASYEAYYGKWFDKPGCMPWEMKPEGLTDDQVKTTKFCCLLLFEDPDTKARVGGACYSPYPHIGPIKPYPHIDQVKPSPHSQDQKQDEYHASDESNPEFLADNNIDEYDPEQEDT